MCVGLARTIHTYIQYKHGNYSREITIRTVIDGVVYYTVLANPSRVSMSLHPDLLQRENCFREER